MVRQLGAVTLSSVVNDALADYVERASRLASLRVLLDAWEAEGGPVSRQAQDAAAATFDQFNDLDDAGVARR